MLYIPPAPEHPSVRTHSPANSLSASLLLSPGPSVRLRRSGSEYFGNGNRSLAVRIAGDFPERAKGKLNGRKTESRSDAACWQTFSIFAVL